MKRSAEGFGLIEMLLALALGLVMTLALTQLFLSSKNTYLSQAAAASLQEDARLVLNMLAQDIRMAGMDGCLPNPAALHGVDAAKSTIENATERAAPAFIEWNAPRQALTLIGGGVERTRGGLAWAGRPDCTPLARDGVDRITASAEPAPSLFPVYRQVYRFNPRSADLLLNGQSLVANVRVFSVLFGVASAPGDDAVARYTSNPSDPSLIRSVRVRLTLSDPGNRVKDQTFTMAAAVRNRLG